MTIFVRLKAIVFISVLAALFSCRKESPAPSPAPTPSPPQPTVPADTAAASLVVVFSNAVDSLPLELGKSYTNAAGESYMVSKLNYFISNVSVNGDSLKFAETDSYHLLQHGQAASMTFTLHGLRPGRYHHVTFMLGVDSARNCSGAQSGALDPGSGMFWTWNSGYIMLKMEGTSPSAAGNDLTFHLGGYYGTYSAIRKYYLLFPKTINITSGNLSTVHVSANLNEMFRTPETISFADFSYQMTTGKGVRRLADNYADMFTVTSAGQ